MIWSEKLFFLAKFDSAINLNHICCKHVCVSRYVVKLNVSVKNEKCSVKALISSVDERKMIWLVYRARFCIDAHLLLRFVLETHLLL